MSQFFYCILQRIKCPTSINFIWSYLVKTWRILYDLERYAWIQIIGMWRLSWNTPFLIKDIKVAGFSRLYRERCFLSLTGKGLGRLGKNQEKLLVKPRLLPRYLTIVGHVYLFPSNVMLARWAYRSDLRSNPRSAARRRLIERFKSLKSCMRLGVIVIKHSLVAKTLIVEKVSSFLSLAREKSSSSAKEKQVSLVRLFQEI